MFVSFKTVKGACYFLNFSTIFCVVKNEKNDNAIIITCDGDTFELNESYDDFCKRVERDLDIVVCH